MRISLIVAFIIAFFALIFASQNSIVITVRIGLWAIQSSLALIVLLMLLAGFIIGLLVSLPSILKRGWKSSRRQRTIQGLEQELNHQNQVVADQKRRIEFLENHLPQGTES